MYVCHQPERKEITVPRMLVLVTTSNCSMHGYGSFKTKFILIFSKNSTVPHTVLLTSLQPICIFPCHLLPGTVSDLFFFLEGGRWRAPQQMLRTHHSLEGLLCNPVMKMISFSFSFFLVMEHRWNEIDRGKPKYLGKTCPSVTSSNKNFKWIDPGFSFSCPVSFLWSILYL